MAGKRLDAKAGKYLAGCDLSGALYRKPPIFARGRNAELWDVKGRRYLDFCAGFASVSLGHGNRELAREAARLASTLAETHSQRNEAQILLAERLAKSVGRGMKTFIDVGGSAGVESCLKFAHAKTGKRGVLCFEGGFHGRSIGLLGLSRGSALKAFSGIASGPRAFHTPYSYCYRCPFGKKYPGCGIECAAAAARMLEANKKEIGIVLAEPAQGSGGYVFPPKEFFAILREACDRSGALLAMDEIQMGVARTGRMYCFEHYGVKPDLVVLGKGMCGGLYPLNAVIGREDIMDAAPRGSMYSAFTGNPLGCGLALKVLGIIERDSICERSSVNGAHLVKRLLEIRGRNSAIGDVEGKGLAVGVELVRGGKEPAKLETRQMIERGLKAGLLLKDGGILRNRLVLSPPLTIGRKEIGEFCQRFEGVLEECF